MIFNLPASVYQASQDDRSVLGPATVHRRKRRALKMEARVETLKKLIDIRASYNAVKPGVKPRPQRNRSERRYHNDLQNI